MVDSVADAVVDVMQALNDKDRIAMEGANERARIALLERIVGTMGNNPNLAPFFAQMGWPQ